MKMRIIKILYVLIASSLFFVYSFFMFKDGLIDGSWVYMINRMFNEGLLWGRNIIFTYGPLGFILVLWDIGNNAVISLAFWLAISVLTLCTTSYIMFSERMKPLTERYDNIFMSFIMLYMAVPLSFQRLGPEYVSQFILLYLLSICYVNRDMKSFVTAAVITVLSMFMKFNSGASNYASMFMLAFVMMIQFRMYRFMIVFLLTSLAFVLCFLAYNPSITELYYYVRGAYEISSGYISGMSGTDGFGSAVFTIFFVFSASAFILIMFTFRFEGGFFRKFQIFYALIFLPCIFMAAKHTFLVHGSLFGTAYVMIPALLICCSVYLIFTPQNVVIRPVIRKLLSVCAIGFFAFTFVFSALGLNTKAVTVKQFLADSLTNPLFRFYDRLSLNDEISENKVFVLPDEFTHIISNDTASVYPYELLFAEKIHNFRNMPVIQAYSAYTAWLDNLNAEFFSDDSRAPKYIVFSPEVFFDRYPLIECPSTWFEIFRNYSINEYRDKYFLLERRNTQREFIRRDLGSLKCLHDDVIVLPETNHILSMKLDMKPSLWGKLAKIFYQIPPVYMTAEYADGRKAFGRVLIDVMNNETIISNVILNDEEFMSFMNGDMNTGKVKSIQFSGNGLKYYSDEISVTFTENRRNAPSFLSQAGNIISLPGHISEVSTVKAEMGK